MLSVSVHKDIGEYTEKVVGKLSARTLACTAGGLASAVAAAAAPSRLGVAWPSKKGGSPTAWPRDAPAAARRATSTRP